MAEGKQSGIAVIEECIVKDERKTVPCGAVFWWEGGRGKAGVVWAADAVGGEKRAGARGIDLGGSGT